MQMLKKALIIGLILLFGTSFGAPAAQAYFSPKLQQSLQALPAHVQASKAQNGTGSFTNIIQRFQTNNTEEGFSAVSGFFVNYVQTHARNIWVGLMYDLVTSAGDALDDFTLAFGWLAGSSTVSSCLRDDLWALQDVETVLLQELFKASALYDLTNSEILWKDYIEVGKQISKMKRFYRKIERIEQEDNAAIKEGQPKKIYFKKIQKENGEVVRTNVAAKDHPFFEEGDIDLYAECPYGEFEQAIGDLLESWRRNVCYKKEEDRNADGKYADDEINWVCFSHMSGAAEWGNLFEMAEAEGRRNAAEYIARNKVEVGLGGPEKGERFSLLNPDAHQALVSGTDRKRTWDQIKRKFENAGTNVLSRLKNEWQAIQDLSGPIPTLFDARTWQGPGKSACVIFRPINAQEGFWDDCNAEESKKFKEGKCGDNCLAPSSDESVIKAFDQYAKQKRIWEKNREAIKKSYNINFVTGATETYLWQMQQTLRSVNSELKSTYLKTESGVQAPLPNFYSLTYKLVTGQCKNKPVEVKKPTN